MITHYAHDVPKDGNCFYACVVKTCGHLLGVGTDISGIKKLRQKIADAVRTDPALHQTIEELFSLLKQCPQLRIDFPFISGKAIASAQVEPLAARIGKDGVWASVVEHSIVKHLLFNLGIDLITLDCTSEKKLYSDCDIEEQLLSALESAISERCIVFVHVANNHYMFLSLGHDRICSREDFIDHIRVFLQSDDESIDSNESDAHSQTAKSKPDSCVDLMVY